MIAPTGRVEGPAYPAWMKVAATLAVFGILAAALRSAPAFAERPPGLAALAFLVSVLAVVGAGYWGMLVSRTSIDGEAIRHTGLWTRQVRLVDITQLKLVLVPGMNWLIVPRLVVRARGLGVAIFPTADARVLAEFRRLAFGAD